jgi:hypothetical protein
MAMRTFFAALAIVVGPATIARAAEQVGEAPETSSARAEGATERTRRDGGFLPQTMSARVNTARAMITTYGGFDGARAKPMMGAAAEVQLWGPIAIRGGAEYSTGTETMRPTIGARIQILRATAHGIDASLGSFYRPEGFTEPEGEIETVVALGRRFSGISLLGNLVYGQDPEGNERDGEIRFAALSDTEGWAVGFDGRARFAIGTQNSPKAAAEPKFDIVAGPIAMITVGPVAFFAQAGASVLKTTETRAGVAALGGLGTGF